MFNYPNPRTTDPRGRRLQRFFEVIPGILTWFTLIGMFVFSFLIPVWIAVFIIAFDIYWLYRTIYISTYSIMAFRKMKKHKLIDWMEACRRISDPEKFLAELKERMKNLKSSLPFEKGELERDLNIW